jgi:3-hydroxybutyryl-CoA dehydrogenase
VSQPNPSERLGIAGSGAIACGLARLAAGGFEVTIWARRPESAQQAEGSLEGAGRVVTDLEQLASCAVVVEAVVEDEAVKHEVLARLGETLHPESLIATTTSSLSVEELAAASGRPDRFAGLHVFNPVEKMELVELVFPEQAGVETRERFRKLCEALGKRPVEVPDSTGFVVNRLLFPYLFDAVTLLERNGLEPEAVDTCMKLGAGHPMGPLAVLDLVGLDVAAAIGEAVGADVPERLRRLIAEGRLGRKSGSGFYEYD